MWVGGVRDTRTHILHVARHFDPHAHGKARVDEVFHQEQMPPLEVREVRARDGDLPSACFVFV